MLVKWRSPALVPAVRDGNEPEGPQDSTKQHESRRIIDKWWRIKGVGPCRARTMDVSAKVPGGVSSGITMRLLLRVTAMPTGQDTIVCVVVPPRRKAWFRRSSQPEHQ